MQKQRSAPNREARIFDSWLDEPGPYLDLTATETPRLRADGPPMRPHMGAEITETNRKD